MAVARRAADASHIATPAATAAATAAAAAAAATAVVTRVRTAATLTAHDSVADKSTHTADERSDDGGGAADEMRNNVAAQQTSARRAPARVSEEPLYGFEPTASEEPELLQPYVEQPRHVTATRHAALATAAITTAQQQRLQALPPLSSSWRRSVRTFVLSAVTGACCVSLVYWTLRARLHDSLVGDAPQQQCDDDDVGGDGDSGAVHVRSEVYEGNSHAAAAAGLVVGDVQTPDSATDTLLGTFVAPSTYAELQYKLQQHRRHVDEHARVALESHDVLHTELLYRCKAWWNRTIANLQRAVAQEGARRDASTAARIDAALRLRGYEVLYVKPVSTTTTHAS